MSVLVGYLLLFMAVGIAFILVHLLAGKMIRPARPEPEKMTIYECGEPTIGSAWIQFDLRFYVVALLFVVFDVEVAFFFPWAVVFGQANSLANPEVPESQRIEMAYRLSPQADARRQELLQERQSLEERPEEPRREEKLEAVNTRLTELDQQVVNAGGYHQLAWFAFWDILVFFGVLLVGFAYLWKRGDLAWVRSTAAERPGVPAGETAPQPSPLVSTGAGQVLAGTGPGH